MVGGGEEAMPLEETVLYDRYGCLVTDRRIVIGDFRCSTDQVRSAEAVGVRSRWWSWLSLARGWSRPGYEVVLDVAGELVRVNVGPRRSLAADLAAAVGRVVEARERGGR